MITFALLISDSHNTNPYCLFSMKWNFQRRMACHTSLILPVAMLIGEKEWENKINSNFHLPDGVSFIFLVVLVFQSGSIWNILKCWQPMTSDNPAERRLHTSIDSKLFASTSRPLSYHSTEFTCFYVRWELEQYIVEFFLPKYYWPVTNEQLLVIFCQ